MLKYQRFHRELMTWRASQFKDIGDLTNITELPYGSILHVFDNFPVDGHVEWGPRSNNHFTGMNKFKMFIHNVTTWQEHKPYDVCPISREKMILTNGGVMSGVMKYLRDNMPRVKYVQEVEDLPIRPSTMSIVNYNPLFRARVLGVRKKIRFFNFLLGTLCNKIMEAQDRQHFIHIPLENFTYEKKDFIRIFKKFDKIATLYPERSSYLMLAHFYGILAKPVSLPMRGKLSETDKEDDSTVGQEGLVDDPFTAEEAVEAQDTIGANWFTNIEESVLDCPHIALEALREGENPYSKSIFEFIPPKMYEKINFIFTVGSHYVCYNLRDMKEINGKANVGILRIINQINNLVRTAPNGALNDTAEETQIAPEAVTTIDEEKAEKGNIVTFTKPLTHQEKLDAAEVDLIELDDVNKILKDMPDLSVKQKEHIVKLSKAYKDLEIDGIKFDKALGAFDSDALTPPTIETQAVKTGAMDIEATKSTTSVLGKTYIDKQLVKDIAAICTSFNKQGMFLTDFTQESTNDELSAWTTYTASFEDTDHKKHKIKIPVPRVDSQGRTKINGTIKAMRMQRVSRPVCKVSKTRVTMNSNYNKALVERNVNAKHSFLDWFSKKAIYKAINGGFDIKTVTGVCHYPVKAFPFEITELGSKYRQLQFPGGLMNFDIDHRFEACPKHLIEDAKKVEEGEGILFGYKGNQLFFITVDGLITVKDMDKNGEDVFLGAFGDFFSWLSGIDLVAPTELIEITYLSKTVPLIHMLGYKYGLTNMLKYCACDYSVHDRNERIDTRPSDIVIKFKDKKLIINRTPRNNALLFGGLSAFDLDEVYLEDMDNKDVYYTLLEQCKISMNFIKGIDSFFALFIDPTTRDILREMKEPTDIRDLLLHVVTLLTTSDHLDESDEANFRYRNVEQITGAIYNEMARAFATYKNRSLGATNKFSLSEHAIKQRIIQDQNMENVSTINPMEDIKSISGFTNAGSGGRSNDTFKTRDRRFTKHSIGIVSEAVPDNGKVGMNAYLPANPIMHDARGMTEAIDIENLQPENVLSFNTLMMPGVTQDDGKRANFSNIQASAVVPTKCSDVSRVRTGFEELVAHRTRPPFAYVAEDDGVIQQIDKASGVMVVRYKTGKKTAVNFGEEYSNNSSNGFFVNQAVVLNGWNKGDHIRKGDVLTYNREFFQADPYDKKTIRYRTGILSKVAILDNGGTIEDASILTQPLCDKMVFNPVHQVTIQITTDTNVRSFAHIGDEINSTEPVIVFDESSFDAGDEDDPELIAMLSKLNTTAPKAGHTGKVVKIECLYKAPVSTMSNSLQKLIKYATEKKNRAADVAEGCSNSDDYLRSKPLEGTTKIGLIELTPEVVVIRFYIKQDKSMSPGDKLFFDSSLKSVCSQVYSESIRTEDGTMVDAATGGRGILQRIITSPFTTGICNRILEKLESDILNIWEE